MEGGDRREKEGGGGGGGGGDRGWRRLRNISKELELFGEIHKVTIISCMTGGKS